MVAKNGEADLVGKKEGSKSYLLRFIELKNNCLLFIFLSGSSLIKDFKFGKVNNSICLNLV
jgi:hypothetical protein